MQRKGSNRAFRPEMFYALVVLGWYRYVVADEHAAPVEPNVTMRVRAVQLVFDLRVVAQFSGLRFNERINRNQY